MFMRFRSAERAVRDGHLWENVGFGILGLAWGLSGPWFKAEGFRVGALRFGLSAQGLPVPPAFHSYKVFVHLLRLPNNSSSKMGRELK